MKQHGFGKKDGKRTIFAVDEKGNRDEEILTKNEYQFLNKVLSDIRMRGSDPHPFAVAAIKGIRERKLKA